MLLPSASPDGTHQMINLCLKRKSGQRNFNLTLLLLYDSLCVGSIQFNNLKKVTNK